MMIECTKDQALAVIDLIYHERSITDACEEVGIHRVSFYMACYTWDEIQEAKDRACAFVAKCRADQALEIKWRCYQDLPNQPKHATIAIWLDKTSHGVRDTSAELPPSTPSPVTGVTFVPDKAPAK